MKDPEMWQRCLAHPMPKGPEGESFAAWCAEEAGIRPGQAGNLVVEYKRFTYLAGTVAVARPVAPGLIGTAHGLHRKSGDLARYCREVLAVEDIVPVSRPRAGDLSAMRAAYEAEFGAPPPRFFWASRSRHLQWSIAALLVAGGAVASVFDGSLAPLALGGIPALVIAAYLLKSGRAQGGDGLSQAARFGGGGGGGPGPGP